jgi:hypothetical protein
MSWVTIDRICQEEADGKEDVRRELVRNGKPLRSSAAPLSDDELLAKLRDFGLDVDRDGVERLCAGALSAEEVAGPIVDKLKLDDDMTVDWVWISLLASGKDGGRTALAWNSWTTRCRRDTTRTRRTIRTRRS